MEKESRAQAAERVARGAAQLIRENHVEDIDVITLYGRKTGAPVKIVVRFQRGKGEGVRGVAAMPVPA